MEEDYSRIRPGQIVYVLQGRMSGSYAIVVKLEKSGYVWVADGKSRKVENPKRKNTKHIQMTHVIVKEIAEALDKYGHVENAKLRYALNQYHHSLKEKP